jgi:glycosyltransferase involved in cell wall biosynthesis
MRIGIVIGRIGGVDGVALETEKWIKVLNRMGHKVFVLSGEFEGQTRKHHELATHFPLLSFFSPECEWEQNKAFHNPDKEADELHTGIENVSELIAKRIKKWLRNKKIELLISQNASALPAHLSMGLGIKKVIEATGIRAITHDHDFHWERGKRYLSPHDSINKFIDQTFPLRLPPVKNVVINSYNKERFKEKFNIGVDMVPNVMDYNTPYGILNRKSRYFLKDLGVKKKEIPLFQITRIVRRKGIETAIELLHKLQNKKLKLIITGNHQDDEGANYFQYLIDLIHDLDLLNQVIFAEKMVMDHKDLSYAYAHARACTYFSTYEGFGNAFIECALAQKPIFINNYKPVYWQDIGSKGFRTVMLEDNQLTDQKLKEIEEIIYDEELCREIGSFNYQLAKRHFSLEVLESLLIEILLP